jgi:hypothetical protein
MGPRSNSLEFGHFGMLVTASFCPEKGRENSPGLQAWVESNMARALKGRPRWDSVSPKGIARRRQHDGVSEAREPPPGA